MVKKKITENLFKDKQLRDRTQQLQLILEDNSDDNLINNESTTGNDLFLKKKNSLLGLGKLEKKKKDKIDKLEKKKKDKIDKLEKKKKDKIDKLEKKKKDKIDKFEKNKKENESNAIQLGKRDVQFRSIAIEFDQLEFDQLEFDQLDKLELEVISFDEFYLENIEIYDELFEKNLNEIILESSDKSIELGLHMLLNKLEKINIVKVEEFEDLKEFYKLIKLDTLKKSDNSELIKLKLNNLLHKLKDDNEKFFLNQLKFKALQNHENNDEKLNQNIIGSEQNEKKTFQSELARLSKINISLEGAVKHLKEFKKKEFMKNLKIPLLRKNSYNIFKIPMFYRILLYGYINEMFTNYILFCDKLLVPAITLLEDFLKLMLRKKFIKNFSFFGEEDFEIIFEKPNDSTLKREKPKIQWVSSPNKIFYYNYQQLKELFYDPSSVFIFGLVITEYGFYSLLDCVHNKLDGELVLLLYIESNVNYLYLDL